METIDTLKHTHEPVSAPDLANWQNAFTGWGVWSEGAGAGAVQASAPHAFRSGLVIAEGKVATKRILGWMAVLAVLGLGIGFLAVSVEADLPVIGMIVLVFTGGILLRAATWGLNSDLSVKVYREGFTYTKLGATQTVRWDEVSQVRESWLKWSFEGIVRLNIHNLVIHLKNGKMIKMNLALDKLPEISRFIQVAVSEAMLPGIVEQLNRDATIPFGPFKINRYGIAHAKKEVLPWNEVDSIQLHTMGQATIQIKKVTGKKRASAWVGQSGGAVPNLQLFLTLVSWFIERARGTAPQTPSPQPAGVSIPDERTGGDVYLQLAITEKEARRGLQKTLRVGSTDRERSLTVKIPPGVSPGTTYRFPGYGEYFPGAASTGTLHVVINVEKDKSLETKLESLQIGGGAILMIAAIVWTSFYSSLDLLTGALLVVLAGGLGGMLMSFERRWIGALGGALGCFVSYVIHILYFSLMYVFFGRESFWNYELVLVLMVSVLPGIGLYLWLVKRRRKYEAKKAVP